MLGDPLGRAIRRLLRRVSTAPGVDVSDAELLERFVRSRDQAAIETLLWRHGPMVLTTCRRMLGHHADSEDCFQATFLVLCRRAGTIAKRRSVGSWLYKVAYRICLRERAARRRRPGSSPGAAEPVAAETVSDMELRELRFILDEELNRLPERYRAPLVLHYLESKTVEQTAQELGWAQGTVSSRLARGKELLRVRQVRRGATLSVASASALLGRQAASAALPPGLTRSTVHLLVAGAPAGPAAEVARSFLRTQLLSRLKWACVLLLALGTAAGAGLALSRATPDHHRAGQTIAPDASAVREQIAGLDQDGDPLPARAKLRLGSVRFRHADVLLALAYSRDGRTLVSAGRMGGIRTWDAATGQPRTLVRYPPLAATDCTALSADGNLLATEGVLEGPRGFRPVPFPVDVRIANVSPDVPVRRLEVPGRNVRVRSVSFSRDGRYLAAGGDSDTIMLWDVATGQLVRRFPGTKGNVKIRAVALSPDGNLLVAIAVEEPPEEPRPLPLGAFDQTLRLWDTTTGVEQPPPLLNANGITALAFSADGRLLACGRVTGEISLWSPHTGRLLGTLASDDNKGPSGKVEPVSQVAFTADGSVLATTGDEGSVRLWEVKSGGMRVLRPAAATSSRGLAFSPDDRTLAVATHWQLGHEITLWDVTSGQRIEVTKAPLTGPCFATHSRDGKTLLTACTGDKVRFRDARGRESSAPLDLGGGGLSVSPDGTLAYSGGWVWDMATGRQLLQTLAEYETFSPDQRFLAAVTPNGTVSVWETTTLRKLWDARPDHAERQCVAFSVDSKTIAWGTEWGYVTLHDAPTGKQLCRLRCPGPCWQVAFCPDGRTLAAAGENYVQLWDLSSRRVVRQLEQAPPELRRLAHWPGRRMAFSADGTILAAAGVHNTIRLWEVPTGRELPTLSGHWGSIVSLDFAPDGKTLVSGSDDTTALVWDISAVAGGRNP
jgi:RNA polymerase sigma factor (sigma-70 family)